MVTSESVLYFIHGFLKCVQYKAAGCPFLVKSSSRVYFETVAGVTLSQKWWQLRAQNSRMSEFLATYFNYLLHPWRVFYQHPWWVAVWLQLRWHLTFPGKERDDVGELDVSPHYAMCLDTMTCLSCTTARVTCHVQGEEAETCVLQWLVQGHMDTREHNFFTLFWLLHCFIPESKSLLLWFSLIALHSTTYGDTFHFLTFILTVTHLFLSVTSLYI